MNAIHNLARVLFVLLLALADARAASSIFTDVVPATPVDADSRAMTLGVKFWSSEPGTISAIRFYRGATAKSSNGYVASLYSVSGTKLGSVSMAKESGPLPGWQQAVFATPIPIQANTTYVAAYYAPKGHYAVTQFGLTQTISSSPLTAPAASLVDGNGVYRTGNNFPVKGSTDWDSANFFVDVVFVPSGNPVVGVSIPPTLFGMQWQGPSIIPSVSFGIVGKGAGDVWPYVEKTRGVRDWSVIDGFVADAQARGLPMMYTHEYSPGWAVADHSSGCATLWDGTPYCHKKPDNMSDLTNFMTAFLVRYCPAGVPKIQYFELYNEPYNIVNNSRPPAADLAEMTHAMYGLIKSNCPAMKIISPVIGMVSGTTGWYAGYLNDYYTALGPVGTDPVDIASIHHYTNEDGATPAAMPEEILPASAITIINTYVAGKPVWNTEGSWGLNTLSADQEAAFIARWHLMHWSNGYSSMSWYAWENSNYGTLVTGSYPYTPKPLAAAAYTQTYNWMVGRSMPNACLQSGTVWTCGLTGAAATAGAPCASSTNALAVWNTAGNSSYTPPSGYVKRCDLAGNITTYPGSGAVTIGSKPILFGN